jgi:hypothetical protein
VSVDSEARLKKPRPPNSPNGVALYQRIIDVAAPVLNAGTTSDAASDAPYGGEVRKIVRAAKFSPAESTA